MTRPLDQEKICIIRCEDQPGWRVSLCRGSGPRTELGQFSSREEATEFALEERDRRREADSVELIVHMPDDCPCYFGG
ncbi:MAG TPA: hypothetical protein VLM89_03240 [Phycisphaerae bacterium]|nr:hypothetical protein [Phycisphaerae bacterium]